MSEELCVYSYLGMIIYMFIRRAVGMVDPFLCFAQIT